LSNSLYKTPSVDWQSELNRIATKHHVIVCWVAIILNPIWFIADYYTIPAYWEIFFVIRICVTALTLIAVLFRNKLAISTELLMLIPVLGISLQNAYMWSVMDLHMLQKHSFAYLALIIGAGMLVLWKPVWTISIVVLSLIVNIFFFHINSPLNMDEILINGGLLVFTVSIMAGVLIHTRYTLTKKEIIARLTLAETNIQLEIQKNVIEEKNKKITDSINYAERIQQAKLPKKEEIYAALPQCFVLFKPKDIVSGDFYYFNKSNDLIFIAAADCTGHGVPGAFMSLIGYERLDDAVSQDTNTSVILELLNKGVKKSLRQSNDHNSTRDGMDIALISFKSDKGIVNFSAANRPLWIIRNGKKEIEEIKGTKAAIGGLTDDNQIFENHEITVSSGDTFYIFTDGFSDQFGGKSGKKLMSKKFKEILLNIQHLTMKEQEQHLENFIEKWRGESEQLDDILVIGWRMNN